LNAFRKITQIISLAVAISFLFASLFYLAQDLILSGYNEAKPFHFLRIFSRLLTISLFFIMIFYCKRVEKRNLISYGLQKDSSSYRLLVGGFLVGLSTMVLLILIHLLIHDSSIKSKEFSNKFYIDIVLQLFVVFTISTVEEWFFRGFLFESLREDYSNITTVYISSFIFASTHFIRPFSDWLLLVPEFLGLFLIGIILALSRVYSGSLYFSIGIHAGWVYVVKLDKHFVNHFNAHFEKVFGGEKLLSSLSAWILIFIVLFSLKYLIALFKPQANDKLKT